MFVGHLLADEPVALKLDVPSLIASFICFAFESIRCGPRALVLASKVLRAFVFAGALAYAFAYLYYRIPDACLQSQLLVGKRVIIKNLSRAAIERYVSLVNKPGSCYHSICSSVTCTATASGTLVWSLGAR